MTDDKPLLTPLPRKTAAATNDVTTAREKADAELKALAEIERDGSGALTKFGGKLAQFCVDGVYSTDPLVAAHHAYEIRRGVLKAALSDSDYSQISKLANFPYVGRGWEHRGLRLVKALVTRSEGSKDRYRHVQTVLVRVKKRAKSEGEMPSVADITAWLKEAQQPKPSKARKPKASTTETVETSAPPDSTTSGALMSDSDLVRKLDSIIEDFGIPKDVAAACEVVRKFATETAAGPTCQVSVEPPAVDVSTDLTPGG